MNPARIAVVHEWLSARAGSERVLEEILAVYPEADLFSLVDFVPEGERAWLGGRQVKTSFIQHMPFARRCFRAYLPFMPLAIEQFDLRGYDLVLSSSHAVAKGVITGPDQLHVSYVHTPVRYAWDLQHVYLDHQGFLTRLVSRPVLHYLRNWDAASSHRVDKYVANSHHVAARIKKSWRRESEVIYPPVSVERFDHLRKRSDFFCTVSRLVPYKRLDLLVRAFTRLGLRLVIIGSGSEEAKLRAIAGPMITFRGWQSDEVVRDHLERCLAFVVAAEEDFGIAPVEAQAAGAPVIAYGRGGHAETVTDGVSGILFHEQTVDAVCAAVRRFMGLADELDRERIRACAVRFARERFRRQYRHAVEAAWTEHIEQRDSHRRTGHSSGRHPAQGSTSRRLTPTQHTSTDG